jgi:hypothetical protein
MAQPHGFYLPLSLPRRLISDLLYFANRVPSVPVERQVNVADLIAVRERATPKPSWCAIFTKAWGLACAVHPQLRRAYLSAPYPRLYQHPISVASIAVERPYGNEQAVFFTHISKPETIALTEIDLRIKWFKDRPLGSASAVRRQLLIARFPWPLRRLLWWLGLNCNGRFRARLMGTFGVSVYSGLGASSLHPMCIVTSTLTYGVIGPDGHVPVRVSYDHRALDGADVARALATLERFLNNEILTELRYLESVERGDRAA